MLRNFLLTTLRHIRRNRLNFIFKVAGLAFSILSLLIIILYVSHQLSFDKFHAQSDKIYRVNSMRSEETKLVPYGTVPPAIGPALKQNFPEVEAYARLGIPGGLTIRHTDKLFRFTGFAEAIAHAVRC